MSDTNSQGVWFKSYPSISHNIDPLDHNSLGDLMDESLKRYNNRPAFSCLGKQMSFKKVSDHSKDFASFLQNELKLEKSDRIAFQMPNNLAYPISVIAAIRSGLVLVNTNPLYTEKEMQRQFKDSGVKAIVVFSNFVKK